MKKCILECEIQHEGFCTGLVHGFNPKDCKAKTDDDLMTEEEYDEYKKTTYKEKNET